MTREELAAANEKIVREAREKAQAATETLRNTCALYLREKLPAGFSVLSYDAQVYGDQKEKRLSVTSHDGEQFTLRFYVVRQSSRYGGRTSFEPCISGTEYQREGRAFRPVYAKRKDGSYNFANILGDIERYTERKRQERAANKARNDAQGASTATLVEVQRGLHGAECQYGRIEHDAGPLRVTISSGTYSSGAVRVQVRLKDEYLNAEQTLALLKKLETL